MHLGGSGAAGAGASLSGRSAPDFALRFVPTGTRKAARHRMHFDLTSSSAEDQQRSVDLALRLGARHWDVGQRGDEGHVVLADPEGNEFVLVRSRSWFPVPGRRPFAR